MRIGLPPSSVNCFEGGAFFGLSLAPTSIGAMRVPRPAAGIMTVTFIAGCKYTSAESGVQMQATRDTPRAHCEQTAANQMRVTPLQQTL